MYLLSLFSNPVWGHVQVLLAGALLAPGKRTVTSALQVMGLSQEKNSYHRVLNRALWSALTASRLLLKLLLAALVSRGVVVCRGDDTIERRRGKKISAKGISRDPVRCWHSHFVKASGARGLWCMRPRPISWAGRVWALPFLTVLRPSERFYNQRGRRHQTLIERAWRIIQLVKQGLPSRAVADSSFAVIELSQLVRVSLITRLRRDAALYAPAPERQPGRKGRPRLKGQRCPSLTTVLTDPVWTKLTVTSWYGGGPREVEVTTDTAIWYHSGLPPVAIRWVLIRDPQGKFEPHALLSTNLSHTPLQILSWFVRRWRTEVTPQGRAHLGPKTQRQWNDRASARTTPALFARYSLITLMARRLIRRTDGPHPHRRLVR